MQQGQVATRGLGAGRGGAAPEIGRDDGARTGGMAWSQSARGWHEEDGAVRPRDCVLTRLTDFSYVAASFSGDRR